MKQHHRPLLAVLSLVVCIGTLSVQPIAAPANRTLPTQLTDQEFWRIMKEFSEPDGFFRSDNLLSNEIWLQYVIPDLVARTKPGGVYMGVGPEQNFTYIAFLKPQMAFITDIRRGNTHTHLMYKALFELSTDRADFVARLFSRKRPDGLNSASTAADIFDAYTNVTPSAESVFRENLQEITNLLVKKHRFSLSSDDLEGIEYVYYNFYHFGPDLSYNSSGQGFGGRWGNFSTYAGLMTQTDAEGVCRSYLANEQNYKVVKELEEKNLIIPLVGDFAGPKAIRAVGTYLKEYDATITAFYLSNVEQYLGSGWNNFCSSVATLPIDEHSTFIRATRGSGGFRGGLKTSLGEIQSETSDCNRW